MNIRSLIVCTVMLLMVIGCVKSKDDEEKSFKESFLQSFIKSCTESGTKKGLKEIDVKNRCDCVGNFLISKYSAAELTKITATDSPESKRIFDQAVSSCK
ncbi:MAG TPA: hypothetical protein VK448_08015 [Dissulfurispiraceae bacterium]|nr:hypothetical protein [Dissulfurispiraceae bacterium]